MSVLRKDGTYIWTAWLSKLLGGDNSCEWTAWFKTQFDDQSWTRVQQVSNLARWQTGHSDMVNRKARELREQGYEVTREAQNQFTVTLEKLKVAIAGKCDLVAQQGNLGWIVDVKSGRPKVTDQAQVLIYLCLLRWARPELKELTVKGLLVYRAHEEIIEPEQVDDRLTRTLRGLFSDLANNRELAVKVPAWSNCRFCAISDLHCQEHVEQPDRTVGTLDWF